MASEDEESKRFIVELDYLNDPNFLSLFEKAKEEFGFRERDALAIPCRPQELRKILDHRKLLDRTNIDDVRE